MGVPIIFEFNNIGVISYNDYLNAVIAILTLCFTCWIGLNTYKISKNEEQRIEQTKSMKLELAKSALLAEIDNNSSIIIKYIKNLKDELNNIRYEALASIPILFECSKEEIINEELKNDLYELYNIFVQLKKSKTNKGKMEHDDLELALSLIDKIKNSLGVQK